MSISFALQEAQSNSPKVSPKVSDTARMRVQEPGSKVYPRHGGAKAHCFALPPAARERVPLSHPHSSTCTWMSLIFANLRRGEGPLLLSAGP